VLPIFPVILFHSRSPVAMGWWLPTSGNDQLRLYAWLDCKPMIGLARLYLARLFLARLYLARLYLARLYLARLYLARLYLARLYLARLYL
jgi:hypothetical protein